MGGGSSSLRTHLNMCRSRSLKRDFEIELIFEKTESWPWVSTLDWFVKGCQLNATEF